jgi:signal transduction histidine kinase
MKKVRSIGAADMQDKGNIGADSGAKLRLGPIGILSVMFAAGILTFMTARECHFNVLVRGFQVPFTPSVIYGLNTWLWWAVVTICLWMFASRRPQVLRPSRTALLIHASIAGTLGLVHLAILQMTLRWAYVQWPAWGNVYRSFGVTSPERFGGEILLYGFIYGVSCLLYSRFQNQRTLIQKLEVERQLTQAQLKALQMQMEPHFLFNTLNALSSLVRLGRNKEASRTLEHLDTILRTTLQRRAPEKVPFAEELRVVESYLAIQQVRFAHRLQVKIETTPEALEGLVPCFILQPLVENAIKHGIAPMEAGGLVETCVKRVGDKLWLQVRDNGQGNASPATKGHGIGIQNTRERLEYFYPNMHEFHAIAPASGGYEVTIQIPYERCSA